MNTPKEINTPGPVPAKAPGLITVRMDNEAKSDTKLLVTLNSVLVHSLQLCDVCTVNNPHFVEATERVRSRGLLLPKDKTPRLSHCKSFPIIKRRRRKAIEKANGNRRKRVEPPHPRFSETTPQVTEMAAFDSVSNQPTKELESQPQVMSGLNCWDMNEIIYSPLSLSESAGSFCLEDFFSSDVTPLQPDVMDIVDNYFPAENSFENENAQSKRLFTDESEMQLNTPPYLAPSDW